MKHSIRVTMVLLLVSVVLAQYSRAETRGVPWTEEQLLQYSTQVFVGEVRETTAFPKYNRIVPRRVRVLLSIKGKVKPGLRDVEPKHPGGSVYFDAEFDQAVVGRKGLFYVGTKEFPNRLMGYREIPAGN